MNELSTFFCKLFKALKAQLQLQVYLQMIYQSRGGRDTETGMPIAPASQLIFNEVVLGKLVDFVRGTVDFTELLRHAELKDEIVVRLTHEDGQRLLNLLTGDATLSGAFDQETDSDDTKITRQLKMAGLCFEWPRTSTADAALQASANILRQVSDLD